jgi:hypothetical protein
MSYINILAFAIYTGLLLASIYAITVRLVLIYRKPRINHALVWDHIESVFNAGTRVTDPDNPSEPLIEKYLGNLRYPFLSSSARFYATTDSKSQALYILIDEKPPFTPKRAEYVIGDGRLFFLDSHDQYHCFPWLMPVFRDGFLWNKVRVLYLVYFDQRASEITTFPCEITVRPYFEARQRLVDQ